MANICDVWIKIHAKNVASANKLVNKLQVAVQKSMLDMDTPLHPLFDPVIRRQKKNVEITGTTRWASTDDEIAVNMRYFLSQSTEIDKVELFYSELGTPVYGRVTGKPGNRWVTDRYVDETALNAALTAIYAIADINDLDAWSAAEQKACAALLKSHMLTHETDIDIGD